MERNTMMEKCKTYIKRYRENSKEIQLLYKWNSRIRGKRKGSRSNNWRCCTVTWIIPKQMRAIAIKSRIPQQDF